jgi:broad specificity phosphatase PhoE
VKYYFVRHGESTANLLREFSNSGCKHPLTETGVEQARALACSLAGLQVERIYHSPVLRAVQTAQIFSEALNTPLEQAEALREWSVGIYEGTTDPAGWELHRRVQEDWFLRQQYDSRMPGGESFHDILRRFEPFIDKLVTEGSRSDRNLLLVSHGGLYIAVLPYLLKNIGHDSALRLRQVFPYTGCVEAETRPDGLYGVSWCGELL